MYALIEFAGKQYKVEEGSSIKVPYIDGQIGKKVTIDKILYMDAEKSKTIGTPIVNGVKIAGEIESHGRDRKVVIFKFKRRKGYQKKNTHRQDYTILKVGKFGIVKKSVATKKNTAPVTEKTGDKKKLVKKGTLKTKVKKTTTKKTSAKKSAVTKKEKK